MQRFIGMMNRPSLRSKESGKKNNERFIVKKLLRPVPGQSIVEQAEQNGEFRSQQADTGLTQGLTKDNALIKDN